MPTTCEVNKNLVDTIDNHNKVKRRYLQKHLLSWGYIAGKKIEEFEKYMGEKYGTDVNSKQFQESLDKVYGPKEGREKMAIKIKALLEGNEIYWDWTKEYILTNLTRGKKIKFKNGQIALNELPQSNLNNIYRTLAAWSSAGSGENLGVGFLGKIRVQLGLPQTVSRKERTGAFYVFQKAARGYHQELSLRINDFMHKPLKRKSKLDYGWMDIAEKVESLVANIDKGTDSRKEAERKMMRIFIYLQSGDAFNNTIIKWDEKIGDYVIATKYNATDKTYKGTDDAIHGWFDYIPLKDYEGGIYYLNIKDSPKAMKELAEQGKRFRKLDDELFDYQNREFEKSVKNIRAAFTHVFKLSGDTLDYALFGMIPKNILKLSPKDRRAKLSEIDKKIENKLGPEKISLLNELKDTINGLAVVNPYWSELNFEKKRNHFPASYHQYKLPDIYTKQIKGYQKGIKEAEEAIRAIKENPSLNILQARGDIKQLEKNIEHFESRIARNQKMINMMDGVGVDIQADMEQIPFVQNQKYAKRMTNSINPKNMRTDTHAYYSSSKVIMSSIERNNLITIMIEQLGRAESKSVRNMIINMFKVPFGFTDVESGLGPISFKTDDITNLVNKMGLKMPAKVVAEKTRMLSSFLSAQMLHGVGTAIQNLTAMQQNIVDYGMKEFGNAWYIAVKSPEKEQWRKLIRRSGVVEFRDFFSKSLTSNIINDKIELDVHNKINGAFIKYYLAKSGKNVYGKKNMSLPDMEKALRAEIKEILKSSEAFVEWSNVIPEEHRAFKRKAFYKKEKLKSIISQYVEWAISKEVEFTPVIKKLSLKHPGKSLWELTKRGPGKIFEVTSALIANSNFNMSAGEELIRTISFIIGVKKAQENEKIDPGNPDDWTSDQYNQAMEIGRLYSFNSNFGLTPQDVGTMWHSEVGNLMGKFKIWSVQKWSKDYNLMKKGWNSLYTAEEMMDIVDKNDKSAVRWVKMLGRFTKSLGKRNLRETNPEFAQMRTFLALQGVTTLLMDVFVFGPFGGTFMGMMLRRLGLQTVAGMRSDLLGLILLPLTLTLRGLMDDDEDETTRWATQHLLRHTMMGYLPSKMLDWTWNVADAMLKSDKESMNEVIQGTIDPILPLRGVVSAPLEAVMGRKSPF